MLVKVGGWKQGLLRFKRNGGWSNPSSLFVKQSGQWNLLSGLEVVNWGLGELLNPSDSAQFGYDTTRGWFRNLYTWNSGVNSKLSADTLSKIRKISGVFTSYFNSPSTALGENYIRLILSTGNHVLLGTVDSHAEDGKGHSLYRGDAGDTGQVGYNVLEQRYSYTLPEGVTVAQMLIYSNGYNGTGINYPFTYRGMKDFQLTLQH